MKTVKLPRRFLADRRERDLPIPVIFRASKTHYTVAIDDPEIPDVLSDAEYYSDIVSMSGDASYFGLQCSARATVVAIKNARTA